jgi:hypothetical protein
MSARARLIDNVGSATVMRTAETLCAVSVGMCLKRFFQTPTLEAASNFDSAKILCNGARRFAFVTARVENLTRT